MEQITKKRTRPDMIGDKNPLWKGGRLSSYQGYIIVLSPQHPFRGKFGYIGEHRLVMEKKLGRYLTSNELVHHINGDKTDNRIENLELFSRYDHNLMHLKEKWARAKWYSFYKSRNCWRVCINYNGKRKYLGSCKTEEEAKGKVATFLALVKFNSK